MSGKLVDTTLLHYFRTKLDTVFAKKSEVGDKNVIEHVQKNGTELTVANKTVNVTVPTRTSELTNDSGFVTSDSIPTKTSQLANDSGYITGDDIPTKTSQLTNDSDFISDANYVHTDNNFTTQEKDKLNGIESGAEVNVQSNWDETDTSSDSFIQNKPTIPTATSQLNNDSNFVSDANYVHTDNNFTAQDKTKLESVEQGAQVNVIEKVQQNGVDLNIENKTVNVTVPTKTSELENDSDFVTSADIPEGGIVDTELSSTSTNPVQNKAIKQETDKILGNLATIETSPAIANHAVGDYIVYDSQLYKVTATITTGTTLNEGTNIQKVTVGDVENNTVHGYIQFGSINLGSSTWATNVGTGTGVRPSGTNQIGSYNLTLDVKGKYIVFFKARFADGTNKNGLRGIRFYIGEQNSGEEFIAPAGNNTTINTMRFIDTTNLSNSNVRMGLYQGSGNIVTCDHIEIYAIYLSK